MSALFSIRGLTTGVSPVALGCALLLAPAALAQEAPVTTGEQSAATAAQTDTESQPLDNTAETDDSKAIVVTGFRASLQSAVNTKRRNEQIVESVSAEDIGKLPDASISESIARLPGLTSQRLAGPGRSSLITVRGFGPDFTTTTLNGRLQTSTNDVRAVEYDQYPSEVVSAVDVYKTPNARLIGQGLAATVDIRTIRPLAYGKRILAVGIKGIYADLGKLNPDSNKFGYRVNGTYVDQFLDDRLGVAFSAAYVDEPYQTKEERAWGYPNDVGGFAGTRVIGGLESYNTSAQLKRLGLTGTLQYEVTPEVTATLDGFYSNFKDDQLRRGVEIPLAWGGATLSNATIEDGVVTSGTFTNVPAVVNNKAGSRHADLYSFGGNLKYDGDNGWSGLIDIGWSKTDRRERDLQTNAGTGPGGLGANDTVDFEIRNNGIYVTDNALDYSDPTQIFITDPNGWGGGAPGGRQHGYLNNRYVEDEILQLSTELERELGTGILKAARIGANYVKRDKSLTPDEYYLQIAGGALQAAVPSQYLLRPVNTWVGLGPMLTYDPRELLADGFFDRVANTSAGVLAKAFQLTEKVTGVFAMVDLEQEFGGGVLTGNIGVLGQHTKQSSDGYTVTAATGLQPVSDGDDFWDVLPSANLNFRFDNGIVVRVAAAREIMRPRMDDMASKFSYGYDVNQNRVVGESGNPRLRPYRANAVDATIEKYFGSKGFIALQFFYKKLLNNIYTDVRPFDFSDFPSPDFPDGVDPDTVPGFITQPVNGKGGKLYGFELAGTLPFETITPVLTGFGVTGGLSYTKTKVQVSPTITNGVIPGYSKWVGNATAFYENSGFSVRGSLRYRSKYLGDFANFEGIPTRRTVKPETIIDGQVGYDFQAGSMLEGLSVFLQGQNLTDEPFVSYENNDPGQTLNYHTFGRRFMLGATFKF
ncbi:TonB-dependent receptor [Sphingomonas arenae]|uniref:TonB-dependent receptor n=1 Tax=Sphingomonas arenae TaxID=2812555 RepID=UPI0019689C77|nr:TonB-dependent receptor [Sphingomonas arenae]